MPATKSRAMLQQYASWPYPRVPLLAAVPSTHPWQLHCDYLWDRCGSGQAPARPRLWLAGCGTFQPYTWALANPRADLVATDISEPSLQLARRRCRMHGVRNVVFAACDLEDPSTWPAGEFDLIECYGVLMNLADPAATLRALGERLTERGVLRLMVYPHFSRTRIFQLQRLARLCGFAAADRSHPARLRTLVRALDRSHPLRHAFATYSDSKNDEGIVDAFLHAGDRGFTGNQLGALAQAAGLEPAFWFHRPWAQPEVMAEQLGLLDKSQSFVLGYLDLWQELRQNFIVCLRRNGAARVPAPLRAHPTFAQSHGSLRHGLRLLRLRLCGGRVPSKTAAGDVVLRPALARGLGGDPQQLGADARQRLLAEGLLLGGPNATSLLPVHAQFAGEDSFLAHASSLRVGRRAPNPLYAHLFAAWELASLHPELGLPDLDAQMGRWLPWATALEDRRVPFGLTPHATMARLRTNVSEHFARGPLPVAKDYGEVRLRNDAQCLQTARAFLAAHGTPQQDQGDAALRELWLLLFGHGDLFTTLLPA